jgi:hypothetical protein
MTKILTLINLKIQSIQWVFTHLKKFIRILLSPLLIHLIRRTSDNLLLIILQ